MGNKYTWCNNREGGGTVYLRLDRAFANVELQSLFPSLLVKHLTASHSDHVPIKVEFCQQSNYRQQRMRKKLFRFEAMWLQDEECSDIIRENWRSVGSNVITGVSHSIASVGVALSNWGKRKFGNVKEQIRRKQDMLQRIQCNPIAKPMEVRRLIEDLDKLLGQEEVYWKQRSRVDWLHEGDRNTTFFHNKANKRRVRNSIDRLQNDEGLWIEQPEEIERLITSYFIDLFTSTGNCNELGSCFVDNKIPEDMRLELLKEFEADEVKSALSQMHPWKAPGPDGMHAFFFQKFWPIVGDDVIRMVLGFLNGDIQLDEINHTLIVLIPKVKKPEKVSEYRPISLCNVVYKLISKTLVNRMKKVLPLIIDEAQSAFVKERQITDNVIIAFEAFHWLKKHKGTDEHFFALKLDMSKAYDRVEWRFLQQIMLQLGFPTRWVDLAMKCVTSVTYSILINGQPTKSFKPLRGLRQGDPLSPYLFILCAEGFSSLIRKAEREGLWNGISMGVGGPKISHLLFADDSLLFASANERNVNKIIDILNLYALKSGQKINYDKSSLFCSANMPSQQKEQLCRILGVPPIDPVGKYLGLPFLIGRSKSEIFAFIKDRVWRKLKGWKERTLSQAGREILIKSVIQAIPTYIMSCFLLPERLCNEIMALVRQFWWGQKGEERKICWRRWEEVCKSKEEGGMGFRNLSAFNLALLAKQGWRLLQHPNSLVARVLKARYFCNADFLSAPRGSNSSYVWQGIWESRRLLTQGLRWRIGNGKLVRIWEDPWLPRPYTFKPSFFAKKSWPVSFVADLIDEQEVRWKENLIKTIFPAHEAEIICDIPLCNTWPEDKLIWHYNNDGCFSVKSAYKMGMELMKHWLGAETSSSQEEERKFWNRIWKLKVPPKVKCFLWRMCWNILPTCANLRRRIPEFNSSCPWCGELQENDRHIFFDCIYAQEVWDSANLKLDICAIKVAGMKELVGFILHFPYQIEIELIVMIMWLIWSARNSLKFEGRMTKAQHVVDWAKSILMDFNQANEVNKCHTQQNLQRHWVPPGPGLLKVNVDAAWIKERTGVGVIVRNEEGKIMAAMAEGIGKVVSVELAELMAITYGLQWAADIGIDSLQLESDSLTITKRLINSDTDDSSIGHFVEKTRKMLHSFRQCNILHVCRSGNFPAHVLAKFALSLDHRCVWWDDFPPTIVSAAETDVMNE